MSTPAVFIIADQFPVGVGGKRGLPGTGKAKEQRGITMLSDIGRTVHTQHIFLVGQYKIEDCENALLISPV